MDIEKIKTTIASAKELKSLAYGKALKAETNEYAGEMLLLAESLALTECHAQCALVRAMRLETK